MRWFWVDRFTEFVSGERATAVKNVALSEEHVHDHFPGYPLMPGSLIIEGMAQTAGILVSECNDFRELVVLAKVGRCEFHSPAAPGETLTYRAHIDQLDKAGARCTTTSRVGDRPQAEAEIFFAHLEDEDTSLFEPVSFLAWLKLVKIFEVGVKPDGSPLEIPAALAAAEAAHVEAGE